MPKAFRFRYERMMSAAGSPFDALERSDTPQIAAGACGATT